MLVLALCFFSNALDASATDTSGWQTFGGPSSPVSMQYPPGWQASIDPKTGRIDVGNSGGAGMSTLSFFVANQTMESLQPKEFFKVFIKLFAPNENWTEPQPIGANSFHSTYSNAAGSGSAAIVLQSGAQGISGQVCVAKIPKGVQNVSADTFATIMSTVRYNATQQPTLTDNVASASENQSWENQGAPPASTNSFAGYVKFTDASEN